jgi:hypothetical protein
MVLCLLKTWLFPAVKKSLMLILLKRKPGKVLWSYCYIKRLIRLCKGDEVGSIEEGNVGGVPHSMLVQSPGYVGS